MTPRTDWKETVAPDEAQRFEGYAQQLGELQRKQARDGKLSRALHAKSHVGARARLTVLPNLPEHARAGIFASPGTYEALVRYSNGAFARQSDRKPDLRGLAVKVLGVPGKKIIPGLEDARTQDFLAIHRPTTPFQSTDEFVFFITGSANPLTLLPRAIAHLGFGRTIALLRKLAASTKPPRALATQRFWSVGAVRWGEYAAKYSFLPVSTDAPQGTPQSFADELVTRLDSGAIEYDLAVQFYSDATRTPIENASVEWSEQDAPFVRVARLTILQQDLRSEEGERLQTYVESLSFDPWHAPVEFRPLGDVQRARNYAYRVSTMARGAAKEPESAEAIVA